MAEVSSDTAIVFLEASSSAQVGHPESGTSTSAPTPPHDDMDKPDEFAEPELKKRKFSGSQADKKDSFLAVPVDKPEPKLESRLGNILGCVVCFDLPPTFVYQCSHGHLTCSGCYTHLMADARLRDEPATCPNCRVELPKTNPLRNLAVEKAIAELPIECQYCQNEYPKKSIERHEINCEERISSCKYSRIGCPWRGPYHECSKHETFCAHPRRTGAEIMGALQIIDEKNLEERKLYDNIFDILSYKEININDIQLKPYRTEEFIHKLFYESSKFSSVNNSWVVTARLNKNLKDPTQSSERDMTYQLVLKTKPIQNPVTVYFILLKGPNSDTKVSPRINKFEFTDQEPESPHYPLPLADSAECNRLLSAKTMNFRIILFLVNK